MNQASSGQAPDRKKDTADSPVLLTGATGFIGQRLLPRLIQAGFSVRCLVRSKSRFEALFPGLAQLEVIQGDVMDPRALDQALEGVGSAYYLVHSLGGGPLRARSFAREDRKAADTFVQKAEAHSVQRIIYLGGLGERGQDLSPHLASRQEVAAILGSGRPSLTVLRAAVIVGAGGAAFEIIRSLVDRLPVIVGPRWLNTLCQPIGVDNVIDFLLGCLLKSETAGREFDICGPDQVTYRQLMFAYARARGLIRFIIALPLSSTRVPAYWVDLVSCQPHGLVRPLLEGMRNEVVCQENTLADLVQVQLQGLSEAMDKAVSESAAREEPRCAVIDL